MAQYPGEPLLADLLKQADDELRAIEMARAIESILREASEFATAKNFGRALSALDQGLEKWPSHGDLLDRRNQIADAEAAWKRQKEIESFSERASTMAAGWISEAPSIWSVERYARIPARRSSINSKNELRAIGSNTSAAKQSRALQVKYASCSPGDGWTTRPRFLMRAWRITPASPIWKRFPHKFEMPFGFGSEHRRLII